MQSSHGFWHPKNRGQRTPLPRFGVPAGYCVLAGKRNKQAKDKQMTFTAIVWSKEQFVT